MRITLYPTHGGLALVLDGVMMNDIERVEIEEGEAKVKLRRYERRRSGLLIHTEGTIHPDQPAVHVMWGAQALCGAGDPASWPPEHVWIALKQYLKEGEKVSCPECRAEAERIVRQTREGFTAQQFNEIFGLVR